MDKNEENRRNYAKAESAEHFHTSKELKPIEKKIIAKYFKGKVLDIGCGTGRTTVHLSEMDYDVTGIDIDPSMIYLARKDHPEIDYRVMTACDLLFQNDSFDTVFFSYNGLDYIYPEHRRFLAISEAERVLKPGGYFIFSSHNPNGIGFRPKFFLRNLMNGSLFSKYKLEVHSYGGKFWTYYLEPYRQIRLIERMTNLKFITLESACVDSDTDIYPHYVFQKPIK